MRHNLRIAPAETDLSSTQKRNEQVRLEGRGAQTPTAPSLKLFPDLFTPLFSDTIKMQGPPFLQRHPRKGLSPIKQAQKSIAYIREDRRLVTAPRVKIHPYMRPCTLPVQAYGLFQRGGGGGGCQGSPGTLVPGSRKRDPTSQLKRNRAEYFSGGGLAQSLGSTGVTWRFIRFFDWLRLRRDQRY